MTSSISFFLETATYVDIMLMFESISGYIQYANLFKSFNSLYYQNQVDIIFAFVITNRQVQLNTEVAGLTVNDLVDEGMVFLQTSPKIDAEEIIDKKHDPTIICYLHLPYIYLYCLHESAASVCSPLLNLIADPELKVNPDDAEDLDVNMFLLGFIPGIY